MVTPAQEFWRKVSTVRPDCRFYDTVETDLTKKGWVLEWFKHRANQVVFQVNFSLETVGETDQNHEVAYVADDQSNG